MTNRKKYKEKLIEMCKKGDFATFYDKYVSPFYGTKSWIDISSNTGVVLTTLWLDEEHIEPEVDWSKVAVDTPILVRDAEGESWRKRYFSAHEEGKVYTWRNGATSWSATGREMPWKYAKLAEVDE